MKNQKHPSTRVKIAAIADLHLTHFLPYTPVGDETRQENLLIFISEMFNILVKNKVDLVLVAGDVCNGSMVQPETLEILTHFIELSRILEVPNVIISGNHDQDGDHSILDFIKKFQDDEPRVFFYEDQPFVYEHEEKKVRIIGVPYCSEEEFLDQAMGGRLSEEEQKDVHNILLAHVGIKGTLHGISEYVYGIDQKDIDEISNGYELLVFGHHHKFQVVGQNGLYVGPIQQTRFDERNIDPGFAIIKLPGPKVRHVPNTLSPRFKVIEDYVVNPEEIEGNIVKIKIDNVGWTEKQNRDFVKEVATCNPYYLVFPRILRETEVASGEKGSIIDIMAVDHAGKEKALGRTLSKIKLSKKKRKEVEEYVFNLFRKISMG